MVTVDLNFNNFKTEVLEAKTPVLVYFWAPWCHYCNLMTPSVVSAAEAAGDPPKWKVGKVLTDSNKELTRWYGVRSIPTCVFFHRGEAQSQLTVVGAASEIKLIEILEELSSTSEVDPANPFT